MAYADRGELINHIHLILDSLKEKARILVLDYQESLDGTDDNFPNKVAKLNDQITNAQHFEDAVEEASINLYQIEP